VNVDTNGKEERHRCLQIKLNCTKVLRSDGFIWLIGMYNKMPTLIRRKNKYITTLGKVFSIRNMTLIKGRESEAILYCKLRIEDGSQDPIFGQVTLIKSANSQFTYILFKIHILALC
jgi:hypothetical protein